MGFGIKKDSDISKEEQAAARKRTLERVKATPKGLQRDGGRSGVFKDYPESGKGSLERGKNR